MLFQSCVVHETILGQLAKALGVQWQMQGVADSGGKAHQAFGQVPEFGLASASLGHQLYEPVRGKHFVIRYRIESIFAVLTQRLDCRADIAD